MVLVQCVAMTRTSRRRSRCTRFAETGTHLCWQHHEVVERYLAGRFARVLGSALGSIYCH